MKRYEVRCAVCPNRINRLVIWAEDSEQAQQRALKWWRITKYITMEIVEMP